MCDRDFGKSIPDSVDRRTEAALALGLVGTPLVAGEDGDEHRTLDDHDDHGGPGELLNEALVGPQREGHDQGRQDGAENYPLRHAFVVEHRDL